ncbi:MAG TPA: Bax inhibitor-1/YccA family protein [Allosphingosinicella sp.]|nr:Bax inhibitor-1/YccA family protein [Allosphingosinicella sp.]
MANWSDPRTAATASPATGVGTEVAFDAGLRKHMLSVYNYMASGVLLTGIVAYAAAMMGIPQALFTGGNILGYLVIFAPLIMVFFLMARVGKMSTGGMQAFFWSFATVMGLSMSVIPLVYDGASIATAFVATSAAFVSLSLWGYTTKKDLSGFGTFLIMGLVGLIIASIGSMLIPGENPAVTLAINAIGVLIFAGLTAYDTQKIKSIYFQIAGSDMLGKAAILGALTLYLDFINMFQFLLSLIGNRD